MKVFRTYKENFSFDYTFIHHDYDDNLEISKISVFDTASLFLEKNHFVILSTELPNFRGIILDELNANFSKGDVFHLCFDVFLKNDESDVGTVEHDSYICKSKTILGQIRQMLVKETIKKACKSFGLAIHRQVKCQLPDLFQRRFSNTIPSDIYASISMNAVANNFHCDICWPESKLTSESLPIPIDVNSKEWRKGVAETLLSMFQDKKEVIVDRIVENCKNAEDVLQDVLTMVKDVAEKYRPMQLINSKHFKKKPLNNR